MDKNIITKSIEYVGDDTVVVDCVITGGIPSTMINMTLTNPRDTMEHKYKMYSIVLRHLDGQNKGIQTAHGVCEYVRKHWGDNNLQQWIYWDKTIVMLNGGTVSDMDMIVEKFTEAGVPFETFEEEDLSGLTTSICLLADERVWDRDTYPSFDEFVKDFTTMGAAMGVSKETCEKQFTEMYEERVGGHRNAVMKEVLNNLRLA